MEINIGFDKIEKILHLSDIHVRNLKRHSEYIEVFNEVYKVVEQLPKESIVYIGGDIAHAKTQMSPELIQVISDFLRNLANLRPTILILGNHDLNLNNRSRLDALSPIVENLNHPNLHFLKESGVYKIANISFVVMSVFDKTDDFIKAKDVDGDIKVALFHGTVSKSETDFGFKLESDTKIETFDGYSMAMLGDIHKFQELQKYSVQTKEVNGKKIKEIKPSIKFSGSLIQQNHGEGLNKGLLIWDVKTKTSEFIKIKNDYGYYTLDIDKGVIPIVTDMPPKARLRIRVSNTKGSQLKRIVAIIRKRYGIDEISINRMDSLSQQKNSTTPSLINIGDISDPNVQFGLIKDYLDNNYLVDPTVLSKIKEINSELNDILPEEEIYRNIDWKLKQFEFDNMFSYGEDNIIEFFRLNGIIGVFAPNAAGKCVDESTEINIEYDEVEIIKQLGFLPEELK